MRTAFLGVGLGLLLSQAACPAESGSECQPGTIGCECVQSTCDVGLTCSDDVCIGSGGPGTSGPTNAGTDVGSGTGGGDGSSDDSITTAAEDTADDTGGGTGPASCERMGGMPLPHGACVIGCTYDQESPGGDLFENCLPYAMLCNGNGANGDWCEPSADCNADADCGEGWKCVSPDGGGYCKVYCEVDSDCPGMHVCLLDDEFDIFGAVNHCTSRV